MAFPTCTTTSNNSGTNTTSISPDIGDNLVAGEIIILAVCKDGTGTLTWPGSPAWSNIGSAQTSDSHHMEVRYRRVDGTEGWGGTGNTITITGASEGYAWAVARIGGGHSTTAPEAAGTFTSANSTAPNPPSLNPAGWNIEDTLWLVAYGWDGNVAHSTYPANYSNDQTTSRWANTGGSGVAMATRDNAVASEDPGTAAIATGEEWAAFTIAVRPANVTPVSVGLVTEADTSQAQRPDRAYYLGNAV